MKVSKPRPSSATFVSCQFSRLLRRVSALSGTKMQLLSWLVVVAVCGSAASGAAVDDPYAVPAGLLIGAGVSAIQTEGAWDADGKGESATDHLLHLGKLTPYGFGNDSHQHDKAADSYHRYKEDVKAAADLGLTLYRFSISWSRVLPDAVNRNEKGIQYYHDLIDEILKYGMTPIATLYHFDHPWILEKQFKGWQSQQMVEPFKEFARLAVREYGGKVKLWITINEANNYCSYFPLMFVTSGIYTDADVDTFGCIRNNILAHAEAYHIFKEEGHDGQVGFSALISLAEPNSTRPEDVYAADVFSQMATGIMLHPVVYGDYPDVAKDVLGSKLQPFTEAESQRIKGTTDFIALNVYFIFTADYTSIDTNYTHIPTLGMFAREMPFVELTVDGNDVHHLLLQFSSVQSRAMRTSLVWAWNQYKLPLVISENGYGDASHLGKKDRIRGVYHSAYLRTLVSTMKEFGVKVLGYCTWSLIDSFEWSAGFNRPFGLIHVDYEGGTLNRSMKDSSQFWIELARTGSIPLWEDEASSAAVPTAVPTAATTTALLLLALAANYL